jgi:hypothetical protein
VDKPNLFRLYTWEVAEQGLEGDCGGDGGKGAGQGESSQV